MDTTVTLTAPPDFAQFDAQQRAQRQQEVVAALLKVLPTRSVLWTDESVTPFECDGLTAYRQRPLAVALPETHEQVGAVLAACHALQVPVVARGAGTGLSGGALPHVMGVTLSLAKLNRIVRIDPLARTAVVECGVRHDRDRHPCLGAAECERRCVRQLSSGGSLRHAFCSQVRGSQ